MGHEIAPLALDHLPPLLTVEQFAESVSVRPVTVWKWLRLGVIDSRKLGRARRIPRTEVARVAREGVSYPGPTSPRAA